MKKNKLLILGSLMLTAFLVFCGSDTSYAQTTQTHRKPQAIRTPSTVKITPAMRKAAAKRREAKIAAAKLAAAQTGKKPNV